MKTLHQQRGATLLVGLVMLVVLTLLAITAINTSTTNLKVVTNMQLRQDALAAAQAAVNQVLSNPDYFQDPSTAPTSLQVSTGGATLTVAMTRPCLLSAIAIKRSELSSAVATDVPCLGTSVDRNSGVMGQNTGGADSECSRVTWRVRATVSDNVTRAQAELTEGIVRRLDKFLADAFKNDSTKRCS